MKAEAIRTDVRGAQRCLQKQAAISKNTMYPLLFQSVAGKNCWIFPEDTAGKANAWIDWTDER